MQKLRWRAKLALIGHETSDNGANCHLHYNIGWPPVIVHDDSLLLSGDQITYLTPTYAIYTRKNKEKKTQLSQHTIADVLGNSFKQVAKKFTRWRSSVVTSYTS